MNGFNRSSGVLPATGLMALSLEETFSPFLAVEKDGPEKHGNLGFALLILSTAALMLRPGDLFPALQNVPIYQTLLGLCLLLSGSRILRQLSSLAPAWPITLLILGMCVSVLLSHVMRGSLYDLRGGGFEFIKICIYYLLVLAWVDTPTRWRHFVLALCAFGVVLTTLALLDYDGRIDLPALRSIVQSDDSSGEESLLRRLCSTGIFHDPNDLGLMLVVLMATCFCFVANARGRWWVAAWMIPVTLFGHAMLMTHSRGAFLALLGAAGSALVGICGLRRAIVPAAIVLPLLLVVFAGRQTRVDLNNPDDTFQTRLDRWSDSLTLFKSSPLFGVGQDQQAEFCQQVAHNSFVQGFAELGFIGGGCFLGAFVLTMTALMRTDVQKGDPFLARARPFIFAVVGGYGAGLLSLSRGYTISTYLILALAAAYINLTPRALPLTLDQRSIRRLAGGSMLFLACTYVFIRVMKA